jgi:DeoR/GlpR family transcriptional regulator of sugar metabolism
MWNVFYNFKQVMEMEERRQAILQEVEGSGQVKVSDLSKRFECSEVTIRNDIKFMETEGLLKRTHGGAVRIEREVEHKYNVQSVYVNVGRKKRIAACAYEFIKDRDTIIIDEASTSFYLATYIKTHPEKRIVVVTNSLLVANELSDAAHVELYMIGGYVGNLSATLGDDALSNMQQFHVDKAFIGVHGINFDVGLTSIGTPQMQVKRAIMKAAEEVYVLADSSKFGGGYLTVICPIRDVHKIITDNEVSRSDIKKAQEMAVPLVIA